MAARVLREAVEAEEEPAPAAVLAELALALFAANERPEAEATLRALLEREPSYATAHYLLGNMLASREAWSDAAAAYRAYLRLEPRGPSSGQARERLEFVQRRARGR